MLACSRCGAMYCVLHARGGPFTLNVARPDGENIYYYWTVRTTVARERDGARALGPPRFLLALPSSNALSLTLRRTN